MLADPARLQERISFQCVCCFGNVIVTAHLGESEDLQTVAEDGTYFFQLVSVVGSKNNLFHDTLYIKECSMSYGIKNVQKKVLIFWLQPNF